MEGAVLAVNHFVLLHMRKNDRHGVVTRKVPTCAVRGGIALYEPG